MPTRLTHISLEQTTAERVRPGQRVRLTRDEPSADVTAVQRLTYNGRPAVCVTVVNADGERAEVYLGRSHTVWLVTVLCVEITE